MQSSDHSERMFQWIFCLNVKTNPCALKALAEASAVKNSKMMKKVCLAPDMVDSRFKNEEYSRTRTMTRAGWNKSDSYMIRISWKACEIKVIKMKLHKHHFNLTKHKINICKSIILILENNNQPKNKVCTYINLVAEQLKYI